VAKQVGHQNITHCQCLLVRDDINLWPLCDVVHGNHDVPVSPLALWKGPAMSIAILLNGALTL
jgi:hypothetical protein